MKKVVITGPESTGKSTLTKALARHFGVEPVPEAARDYLENRPTYSVEDVVEIAKLQVEYENRIAAKNPTILLCDTDLRVVRIWLQYKYDITNPWVESHIQQRPADLYLLTDIDLPWEDDPLRENPNDRAELLAHYQEDLRTDHCRWTLVSGTGEARLQCALNAIQRQLKL